MKTNKSNKVWVDKLSREQVIFLVSAMGGFAFLFLLGVVALFNYIGFMEETCIELTLKCTLDWISKFIIAFAIVMASLAFALKMVLPIIKRWEKENDKN